jgi:hypothetical protein
MMGGAEEKLRARARGARDGYRIIEVCARRGIECGCLLIGSLGYE